MTAADVVSLISAVSAAAVAIIAAWRGESVRKQLQTHVQHFHVGGQGRPGGPSQE